MSHFKSYICLLVLFASFFSYSERDGFRDYDKSPEHVKKFYLAQHTHQTYAFAKDQSDQFNAIMEQALAAKSERELQQMEKEGKIRRMSIWEAIIELDSLVDESDPDIDLPNSYHALQTAEAVRANLVDGQVDWLILVGLLHDIGKVDALLRETPQWAVTGDTFPVGCRFDESNIFLDYFKHNPDTKDSIFQTKNGVYRENVGLNNLIMAWGHDEYAYRVLSAQGVLPEEGLSVIRFHSFYPLHREGGYLHLLNCEDDQTKLAWLKRFNPYDLYSKSSERLDKYELGLFYKDLINKYFPSKTRSLTKELIWPILKPISLGKDEL